MIVEKVTSTAILYKLDNSQIPMKWDLSVYKKSHEGTEIAPRNVTKPRCKL